MEIDESAVTVKHLVSLLKLIDNKTVSGKIAKEVFDEMFNTGKLPEIIIEEKQLVQIVDEDTILKIVDAVIEENPQAVADLKAGKERSIGFLVGQVMKLSKGKANPEIANRLIRAKIK
jgi:aspartyl-tRNA(Asn)/glutamyl-tRNA(Gln) amidotransferase subunit B